MLNLEDKVLVKLQDVLRTKEFSQSVKEQIREVLSKAFELSINKEDQGNTLFAIIEGLKKIDTFKIDTRECLNKVKAIGENLAPDTDGFVNLGFGVCAVVKESQTQSKLYHELTHISQDENSYTIDQKYGYSNVFREAMVEGEAIFHGLELLKQKFPTTYLTISSMSILYKVFYEFYMDMRNLLGSQMLQKCKENNGKDDIMIEFNRYTKRQYNCDFYFIYRIWGEILKKIVTVSRNKKFINLLKEDSFNEINYIQNSICDYKRICEREKDYKSTIERYEKELIDINEAMSDPKKFNEGFNRIIEKQKKELSEYISESNYDKEVAKEWEEDIKNATTHDYYDQLTFYKNEYTEKLDEYRNSLKINKKNKENLQWTRSYMISLKDISFYDLVVLKKSILNNILTDKDKTCLDITKRLAIYGSIDNLNQNNNTDTRKNSI